MKYLIIKIKDNDIYTDDFNYYVKHINYAKKTTLEDEKKFGTELLAQLQETSQTYLNDMFEIPDMDHHNEHGLVFLGDNYFAIPSVLDDDDDEGEESDGDSQEEEENDDNPEEKKENVYTGYSIHRLTDGS
jgi:hypothetical protein